MSTVIESPFKKPVCGDMYNLGFISMLRDVLGGLINVQAVGTDPDITQPIVGAAMTDDYFPSETPSTVNLDANGDGLPRVNPDGTFFIIPETAGVFAVVLADGTQFLITDVQSTAYLGQPMPFRLLKVLETGTTGNFSVVY